MQQQQHAQYQPHPSLLLAGGSPSPIHLTHARVLLLPLSSPQVPPEDFHNLATLFHSVVVHLSYHPRYGTLFQSPAGQPPQPGSMEHPLSREHWLFSVDVLNAVSRAGLAGLEGLHSFAGQRMDVAACPQPHVAFVQPKARTESRNVLLSS